MRILSIVLISLCCFCWETPFEYVHTTSQKLFSGIANGSTSTQYTLTLVSKKSSDQLSFSSFIIDADTLKVQAYKKSGPMTFTAEFDKGDTLLVLASKNQSHKAINKMKPKNSESLQKKKCDGSAELQYIFKGKAKSFCIDEIEALKNLHMP